ncbi:MAG: DUF3864 domain-containing protein [Acidobacteriaceae bacterium]
MNRSFRVALLEEATDNAPPMVIDYTRYDLPAREPQGLQRDWSLINVLNQKGTRPQDKPRRLEALEADDQARILARYPQPRVTPR